MLQKAHSLTRESIPEGCSGLASVDQMQARYLYEKAYLSGDFDQVWFLSAYISMMRDHVVMFCFLLSFKHKISVTRVKQNEKKLKEKRKKTSLE